MGISSIITTSKSTLVLSNNEFEIIIEANKGSKHEQCYI